MRACVCVCVRVCVRACARDNKSRSKRRIQTTAPIHCWRCLTSTLSPASAPSLEAKSPLSGGSPHDNKGICAESDSGRRLSVFNARAKSRCSAGALSLGYRCTVSGGLCGLVDIGLCGHVLKHAAACARFNISGHFGRACLPLPPSLLPSSPPHLLVLTSLPLASAASRMSLSVYQREEKRILR